LTHPLGRKYESRWFRGGHTLILAYAAAAKTHTLR
jgi:hypothetical protein